MSAYDDDQHDPLLDALRDVFAQDDPVPPLVTQTAKAALGWRRLDADLAELLADSALETNSLALARGDRATLRVVTFSAPTVTIDLEIQDEDAGRTALGKLSPPMRTIVEVQTADQSAPAQAITTEADDRGRFRAKLPAASSIRLRVATRDPDQPNWIETSWIPL
jgi:hypothetical protein